MHISFRLASTDTNLLCQYTTPSNNNMHYKTTKKTKLVGKKWQHKAETAYCNETHSDTELPLYVLTQQDGTKLSSSLASK